MNPQMQLILKLFYFFGKFIIWHTESINLVVDVSFLLKFALPEIFSSAGVPFF